MGGGSPNDAAVEGREPLEGGWVLPFMPFSAAEVSEVLATCSNSLVPSPSHMSWPLLTVTQKSDSMFGMF